jgi:hypothetical protein
MLLQAVQGKPSPLLLASQVPPWLRLGCTVTRLRPLTDLGLTGPSTYVLAPCGADRGWLGYFLTSRLFSQLQVEHLPIL